MLIFQSSKILVVVSTILLVLAVVNCAEHSETVDEVADHNKDQEHHDAEPDVAHKKQAGAGTEVSNDEDDYDTETDQTAVEDESSGHVAAKNEPVVAAAEISTNKKSSSSSSDHQNNEFNDQNEETEEDGYGGTDEDGQEGGTGDDEEEEETNDTEDFSDDDVDKMNTLNANTNDIVPIPAQGGGSGGGQIYQSHRSKLLSIITKPGILAGIVGGAIIGILTAILLIMFIVYRMRKKDEGSYALEESKKPLNAYDYRHVPTKEFYA